MVRQQLRLFCVGIYYFLNRGGSVGLDSSIVDADGKEGQINLSNKKALVVYFSESGNTQKLANTIYEQVGGILDRLHQ